MTNQRASQRGEIERLRAALTTAHDHLHAGRVDDAHESLHCAVRGEAVRPENVSVKGAAALTVFMGRFTDLCRELDMNAAAVCMLPSASRPGYVSIQLGGSVQVIKELRAMMGKTPTITAGG